MASRRNIEQLLSLISKMRPKKIGCKENIWKIGAFVNKT